MKTYVTCILIFIFMGYFSLNAQNKEILTAKGITSKIEWKFKYDDGEETKYKEAEYTYDKMGNTLMEKTFDDDGNVLIHLEYKYDELGNIITETTFNNKGKVTKREEFKYQGKLKLEKKTFDADGNLKSKKIFEYK